MTGRTHNVLVPEGRIVYSDLLRIDHWRSPDKGQPYALPMLEYGVLKENDVRSRFYLGREYLYQGEFDRALTLFGEYMPDAPFLPEKAQAHLYMARCYWQTQRGDEARRACLEAVLQNPDHQAALEMMSEVYFEPWKSKWAYIAANATNRDILY